MLVANLLDALFKAFPLDTAEPWDHVGLSVGDPSSSITGVTCALDATLDNVRAAHKSGSNVLLTHHPVYIKAPDAFKPAESLTPSSSSVVYEAARLGVSVISMHTNLDRSAAARTLLPELMGFTASSSLEFVQQPDLLGLGAVADIAETNLAELASCASRIFHTQPRVWGDPSHRISRVAFLGGSLGDFGELALSANMDAIICGEAGYHICRDLSIRGLDVLLLGHDRSEEPFVEILAKAAQQAGVTPTSIATITHSAQWWTAK